VRLRSAENGNRWRNRLTINHDIFCFCLAAGNLDFSERWKTTWLGSLAQLSNAAP
jgi:hypothetical protein